MFEVKFTLIPFKDPQPNISRNLTLLNVFLPLFYFT